MIFLGNHSEFHPEVTFFGEILLFGWKIYRVPVSREYVRRIVHLLQNISGSLSKSARGQPADQLKKNSRHLDYGDIPLTIGFHGQN